MGPSGQRQRWLHAGECDSSSLSACPAVTGSTMSCRQLTPTKLVNSKTVIVGKCFISKSRSKKAKNNAGVESPGAVPNTAGRLPPGGCFAELHGIIFSWEPSCPSCRDAIGLDTLAAHISLVLMLLLTPFFMDVAK